MLPMMDNQPEVVWIDILKELKRVTYPSPFVQPLGIAAMDHPSADVRRQASVLYSQLPDGNQLIQANLAREKSTDVIVAILRHAHTEQPLSAAVGPLLDTFTRTESPEVADAVAALLAGDDSAGSKTWDSFVVGKRALSTTIAGSRPFD